MFETIINWFVFIMLAGVVAVIAAAFGQIIVDTIKYQTKANAFLALFGFFGGIFAFAAPAVFNSVIPANNWGFVVVMANYFVVMPALLFLALWAWERN